MILKVGGGVVVILGVGGLLGEWEDDDDDEGVLRLTASRGGSSLTSGFSSAFGSVEVEATRDAGFEARRCSSRSKARAKVQSRLGEPVERLGVTFLLGA